MTQRRDTTGSRRKVSQSSCRRIDWNSYFTRSEINDPGDVIVTSPSFFEGLDKLVGNIDLATWRMYLKYQILDAAAPYLSTDFVDAHFDFHSKALAGIPEQKPRWKRGVRTVEGALGEVVGKLYVEKYFPPEAKQRMEQLVQNLIRAFGQSIDELTWMTDATKERAQEKLSKFTVKIGYPNKWKDYSGLTVSADNLLGNVRNSALTEHRRNINKLGKPIDREEWGMTPQTVNAYYSPPKNEIVFPAAILQPPFFNMAADDAVNYGAIGAVIGHEISHGFDDQGSKYDGDGNLKSWWTPLDRKAFEDITKKLVDQFAEYTPLPGRNVDGQLTLGENIADLSGLSIAHKAYRISLDGKEPAELDGWSGDQRFFLGWSQVWRRKYRDAEMMRRLLTDPHAPSWYRANGPVINIDAFYSAFDVKPDDACFVQPRKESASGSRASTSDQCPPSTWPDPALSDGVQWRRIAVCQVRLAMKRDELIRKLEDSGLSLTAQHLREIPNHREDTADSLTCELIRDCKLTEYQASVVLGDSAESLLFGEYEILDRIGQGGMGSYTRHAGLRLHNLRAQDPGGPPLQESGRHSSFPSRGRIRNAARASEHRALN